MFIALVLIVSSCGGNTKGPGEACSVSGDGFTRRDPCEHACVNWEIECEDGSRVVPSVCSAGPCRSDADCADEFVCMQLGIEQRECLPASECP